MPSVKVAPRGRFCLLSPAPPLLLLIVITASVAAAQNDAGPAVWLDCGGASQPQLAAFSVTVAGGGDQRQRVPRQPPRAPRRPPAGRRAHGLRVAVPGRRPRPRLRPPPLPRRLRAGRVRLAARAAGGGAARMFATGEAVFEPGDPADGTMYGLVQCMPDGGAAGCDRCLQASIPQLPNCCRGNQGGVVLSYNCYLRVQIYTYYDLALNGPPPPPPAPVPLRPPPASAGGRSGKRRSTNTILAVALPVGTLLVLVFVLVCIFVRRRRKEENKTPPGVPYFHKTRRIRENRRSLATDNTRGEGSTYTKPEQFTLPLLREATGNFSPENKLGEGGFGEVFKGKLQDGQIIAVKRLSKSSNQGFHELKNELVLAAKLTHRNLVHLLGVCLEEQERLVVYEYLPNRSLDTVLFNDPERGRRHALNWRRRYRIICGIARGLQYLHEESRLRVIHRDLKPSNVLLDEKMNPRISDFGLARAFWADQSRDVTKRPAGTLGYMSPEYAYCGHVSTKSDMFSFGVIVLEIVTGRRNSGPCEDANAKNLLSHVWEKWSAGSVADTVDASMGDLCPWTEILNCVQVGLLCVQRRPEQRPDASAVVLMLDGQTAAPLQAPSRPAFYAGSTGATALSTVSGRGNAVLHGRGCMDDGRHLPRTLASATTNSMTISVLGPR